MQPATDAEQGKLRKAAHDGAQATIGVAFFVILAALFVGGLLWVLGHRWSPSAPELLPSLPTLPGKDPQPQRR